MDSQIGSLAFRYFRSYSASCHKDITYNGHFLHFNTLVLPIFDKSVFISSGWGLTEHGKKYPKVLRSVNLKVSAEEPTGFLRTLGREKEYGVCKVI